MSVRQAVRNAVGVDKREDNLPTVSANLVQKYRQRRHFHWDVGLIARLCLIFAVAILPENVIYFCV